MSRPPLFLLAAFLLAATSSSQLHAHAAPAKRPMTFADLMAMKRVGEPVPSPDGKWVAFEQTDVDLAANTKTPHLWIVPADGGDARRLIPGSDHPETRPRFSPDGKQLIFTSKVGQYKVLPTLVMNDKSRIDIMSATWDTPQVWITGFDAATGTLTGTPRQLTDLSTGADGAIWSPDGKNVVFVSTVYPDAQDDAANKQRDDAKEKSKVKAQLFTHLFYRHWSSYTDGKRSHLFVVPVVAGAPRDLTPGDHDVPPFSLGGQDMYAISPDGQELAYTSNIDEVEATSTNNEIFVVPLAGGPPKKLSTSPGSDSTPLYSPDGKYLAWRSQARAGFESDKQSLLLYDRANGTIRNATEKFDRSVEGMAWSPKSDVIFFTVEDHGIAPVFSLPLDVLTEDPDEVCVAHAGDLAFAQNPDKLFFSSTTVESPSELAYVDVAGWNGDSSRKPPRDAKVITHVNAPLLFQLDLAPWESFTFRSTDNSEVQGFLLKPPGFDATKKYPVKFLIHGGPQGAWSDSWSYRWNPELMAADGYVVIAVNPHGSTGYGQAFTDEVSGDWGGQPYQDLMAGLDYAEKTYGFIDKDREAALGASYGGFMVDWILGHTDRFRCLVTHDGLFDAVSAYGATEELWFPEWEFKGTPWTNPAGYAKWSPSNYVQNFKTPTLVIHGQLDYRLDVSQGFALFTTLQRLGIPSEMLYFPDEGHWVLKPQNSELWNKTVSTWVNRWTAAK